MMKQPGIIGNEAFDRLPTHIQQSLLIVANILQRITAKQLDNVERDALINAVPTTNGDDNEDRQTGAR